MKRSRTRRIFSLFMVLTGILLVFSGFLQDAGGPAVLAAKEDPWPNCDWNCSAKDVKVEAVWLETTGAGDCKPGEDLVSAELRASIDNGTGTGRYAPYLIAELWIDGEYDHTIEVCLGDTLPSSGVSEYLIETLDWPCGSELKLKAVVITWTTQHDQDCSTAATCKGQGREAQSSCAAELIVVAPLVASFSWTPECRTVQFTDQTSGGKSCGTPPYTYEWDFGDGTTPTHRTEQNPSHPYASSGEYTVELTVTDCDSPANTRSYTLKVTVPADPDCTISASSAVCEYSTGHTASVASAGPEATYAWTIAGGAIKGGQGTNSITWDAGAAGAATIGVTVEDVNRCKNSCEKVVTVDPPPTCSIATDLSVCAGSTNNTATGPAGMSSYAWTITGGTAVSGQDERILTYTAGTGASVTIGLTVEDADGCESSCDEVVTVNANPAATASDNSPVCEGETLTLTGGPGGMATYLWTGPYGFTSHDQSPTRPSATVAMAGLYALKVTDANGCTDEAETTVVVKVSPVASFTTASAGPLKVQFTDTSSGNIVGWSWAFGDTGTSTEQNPTHTYAEGTYTVILTVTDANGCTDSIEKVIAVSAEMIIEITSTDDPCDGNEICFWGWADLAPQRRVSLSALEGYTFLWDFGDPDTSDDWSDKDDPCYMYTGPGTYDVTLTVTHDETEVSATASKQVTVYANPVASFTAVPDSGVAPLTVQFNDTSTVGSPNGGAITVWKWDFGDPASGVDDSSRLKDPTHVYASAGTYTVVLIVTDEHGCTDTSDATTVTVTRPALTIEKTADKSTANIGDVINYTITVENTGDLTLTKVRVQDSKLGIDETIDSLAPGKTAEVSGTYGPVTEDDLPGPIHNVATATSNETPDPVEDTWDVTVISGAAIQVVKTADEAIAMVGEPIKYTYDVTNLGDVTLTSVTVTDDKLGSITLGSETLAKNESTSGVVTYIVVVGDLPGPLPATLVNVATASGKPPVGTPVTDEDDASVLVVEPYAPAVLLSIEKTGDIGPLSVFDTINYTIKVTNSGDATLTNVVVNDTKLGIIDLNIGDLDPGETSEITASYGPLEVSDVGYVDNTASAESDQTEPVEDSWRVQVVEPGAEPEPTPTPIPCIRSDIDVIVYGKIPVEVDMYIAGDLDHSKQTAVNAFGEQQATFSVWPGEGETYVVSITPRVPGYLAPDEWTFQLIEGSLTMRIPRCVHREVILQLLHSGAVPTPAPTLPVEELPVTGVPLPASSFGGRLLKLLGFLLIGSGGLFYWTSRRD